MIKHVFLDLDDTLFDFRRSERVALSNTLSALGIEPTDEVINRYSVINKGQWEALERGEATREEILPRRYAILFSEFGVDIEPMKAQKLYEKSLSTTYFYIDGAESLIRELHKDYKTYVASNGTAVVQDGRIGLSGIDKHFDKIFISERVGYNKPSKEFFDACFKDIGEIDLKETIIIGDSLTSDILGGRNAGILTCLYNPKGNPVRDDIKPDYEVRSLDEIPDLLKKII